MDVFIKTVDVYNTVSQLLLRTSVFLLYHLYWCSYIRSLTYALRILIKHNNLNNNYKN